MPIVILTAVHQTYFFQRMVKIFPRQACFSQYSLVLPLQTIPCLCSELAQLQGTYILQGLLMIFTLLSLAYMILLYHFLDILAFKYVGDYDLKVMRQEYYINRQKTVCTFITWYICHVHFFIVSSSFVCLLVVSSIML